MPGRQERLQKKVENIDNNKRLNKIVDRRYVRMDKKYEKAKDDVKKTEKLDKKYSYNYTEAKKAGITPDSTGHWASIGNDGLILKSKNHPSFIKTRKVEKWLGNKIIKDNGNMYTVPKNIERESGHTFFGSKKK